MIRKILKVFLKKIVEILFCNDLHVEDVMKSFLVLNVGSDD